MADITEFSVSHILEAQAHADNAISKLKGIEQHTPIENIIEDPVSVSFNAALNNSLSRLYAAMASHGDIIHNHKASILDKISKSKGIDSDGGSNISVAMDRVQ